MVELSSVWIAWTRVRRPRLLSRLALGAYAGSAILLGIGLFAKEDRLAVVAAFLLPLVAVPIAMVLMIASYVASFEHVFVPADLTADDEALRIVTPKRVHATPRAKIVSALEVEPARAAPDGGAVEIELRDGDRVTVQVGDGSAARALVEGLGFGPAGAPARVSLASRSRRSVNPLFGLAACAAVAAVGAVGQAVVGPHGPEPQRLVYFFGPALSVLLYLALARATRPPRVTVGEDGVTLERARRRFVGWREVGSVTSDPGGASFALARRDGTILPVGGWLVDRARVRAVGRLCAARLERARGQAER